MNCGAEEKDMEAKVSTLPGWEIDQLLKLRQQPDLIEQADALLLQMIAATEYHARSTAPTRWPPQPAAVATTPRPGDIMRCAG